MSLALCATTHHSVKCLKRTKGNVGEGVECFSDVRRVNPVGFTPAMSGGRAPEVSCRFEDEIRELLGEEAMLTSRWMMLMDWWENDESAQSFPAPTATSRPTHPNAPTRPLSSWKDKHSGVDTASISKERRHLRRSSYSRGSKEFGVGLASVMPGSVDGQKQRKHSATRSATRPQPPSLGCAIR